MGRASCHYANPIGEFVSPPAAIITPPWTPPFFPDKPTSSYSPKQEGLSHDPYHVSMLKTASPSCGGDPVGPQEWRKSLA